MASLILLSLGHFCVDLYSSSLGAFQPMLVARHHLSLAQAGLLGGVLVFSSSVMQPVYDPATGGCRDGLHPDRLNENQGAESSLAFYLSRTELARTTSGQIQLLQPCAA